MSILKYKNKPVNQKNKAYNYMPNKSSFFLPSKEPPKKVPIKQPTILAKPTIVEHKSMFILSDYNWL
jgi:hypothetical protein